MSKDKLKSSANTIGRTHFFQRVDGVSFSLASLLSLAVYLFTLIPDADLEFSGIFATSAMYLGVSNPPAYPLWTIYSWLIVKLLPVSNIAWRVAMASALASALTCGLIALVVSRIGLLAAKDIRNFGLLSVKEQNAVRIVCGCVAGLGFGLDGCFWRRAVIPDQWNFNVFLFALAICLLTRWFFAPEQKRCLYLAALVQGLILVNSQALFPTAYALPFLLALGNPRLGREIFFLLAIFFCAILTANHYYDWFWSWLNNTTIPWVIAMAVLVLLMWQALLALTRKFFSEWKTTLVCVLCFITGLGFWLLLPVFSMANPPVNWGYPRTVEGFFHVLSRGQYSSPYFTQSLYDLLEQWTIYGEITIKRFGAFYMVAASIPLLLLHTMSAPVRKWIIGLLTVWFLVTALMLIGLNPTLDKTTFEIESPFFAATHLVLALLAGCGMMLAAAVWGRPSAKTQIPLKA